MHRVLFTVFNFPVYTYGVMLVTGFMAGILFTIKRNRSKSISTDNIMDFSLYLLLGGIVGARLVYVLLHFSEYIGSPLSIINLREGGLSWHGALLGGLIAFILIARKRRIKFGELVDLCSPGIMLGLAVGRLGCFMNGCCLGDPTTLPWGVVFPEAGPLKRHPTQIYELILDIAVVIFLLYREKNKKFDGEIGLLMLSAYSLVRFFVEFFRYSPPRIAGLSIAQYLSLLVAVVTVIFVVRLRTGSTGSASKSPKKRGG
ncbi:MAG: prolipoprotein diacylglyceryl transferase [Candidatus Xenobiia bacterium LiM19]